MMIKNCLERWIGQQHQSHHQLLTAFKNITSIISYQVNNCSEKTVLFQKPTKISEINRYLHLTLIIIHFHNLVDFRLWPNHMVDYLTTQPRRRKILMH